MIGLAGVSMACAAGAAWADGAEHTLRSDNGVYELSYTVVNNEAMIGNYYFVPGDEPLSVGSVEVALGFGQGGLPFELYIYNDPDNDGNPSNAVLLSTTQGTVAPDGTDPRVLRLQTVEVDPVDVTGGFFVAVRLTEQPYTPPYYNGDWETAPSAYRLNYAGPTNNWRIVGLPSDGPMGGINPIDVEDLSTNFVTNVQLNWVIRVTGTVAEPPLVLQGDMNGDGRHDLFDIAMFLDMFQTDNADFNGDGVTDFFDLAAFMAAWQQNPN
jgi:hypothetical protein